MAANIADDNVPVTPGQAPINGPFELKDLRKMLDDSRYVTVEARVDSQLSRDYYDGYQLTPDELEVYAKRKQPPIQINRVQRAIDGIMGVVEQGRSDPRALMRNPPEDPQAQQQPDDDAGDVASMTLRFIADTTDFENTNMDVLENGLIEGCGAAIVEIDGQDVSVTQIRWEEFFFDPYSRRHDFKDARYKGIAKWMYSDDLSAMYPQAKEYMAGFVNNGILGGAPDQTWEDRPNDGIPWVDGKKKRVMVAEIYHQHGGIWYRAVIYCAQILEYDVSPYQDDKKNPICPIEGWASYVDRQNRRYGVVKPMRPIQDEINMRRSKALHEINSRQVQQMDLNAPPVSTDTVRDEAARPDGVLPTGYNVIPRQDVVANNINLMTEAKSEIERMAPAPSVLGRGAADASGRAQQVNQQAGLTELARVLGRHHSWKQRMYFQMWARARQFWTGPKWIRVTSDADAPKYIQVNVPSAPKMQIDPQTGQPQVDPQTGQPVMVPGPVSNHIAEMQVDIVLEDVPDTATLQQEQFNEFMAFAQANPGSIPPEMLIELSSIPEKHKFIKKLKEYKAQQAPQQQAETQLKFAGAKAEVDLKTAQAGKAQADAQSALIKAGKPGEVENPAEVQADINLKNAQAGLIEVQTVETAMLAHMRISDAADLPDGYMLDGSGKPVPIVPPTPTKTGASNK